MKGRQRETETQRERRRDRFAHSVHSRYILDSGVLN